jgi:hypothetical protein
MSTLTKTEATNGHAVTLMAREILSVILPFGTTMARGTDEAVLAIVARPEKSDEVNMQVVHNVTNTVAKALREGLAPWDIEDRVLLELLWLGYWAPEL